MKTIILLLTIIFTISLFSCNDKKEYIKGDNVYISKIKYFKDYRTNLCYAQLTQTTTGRLSYICVPCDSVQLYLNAE